MSIKKLFIYFLLWRVLILFFSVVGANVFTLQTGFLGGGVELYRNNPVVWSLVNFDGEHFLNIAKEGYKPLTYFYFPGYPILISFITKFFGKSLYTYLVSGLLISHLALFMGLIGFVKLIKVDFEDKISQNAVILLLLFPTSFYFAAYYSEALFFCLTVWCFYFYRKKKYFKTGVLGIGSTLTRLVGVAVPVSQMIGVLFNGWKNNKNKIIHEFSRVFLVSFGLLGTLSYMIYLKIKTDDPLEFFHSVAIFGNQRSSKLVILPQVFYRYIFKVLPNINYDYFPAVFFTYFEFGLSLILVYFCIIAFFRLKISYAVYLTLSFLIPTFSGSFSSLPRYAITMFPLFILLSEILIKKTKTVRMILYLFMFILFFISTAMFTRGYWIS